MPKSRGSKNSRKTQRITKRMIAERTKGILKRSVNAFARNLDERWVQAIRCSSIPTRRSPAPCLA